MYGERFRPMTRSQRSQVRVSAPVAESDGGSDQHDKEGLIGPSASTGS